MQNKANVKMGKMSISIVATKAYANKQRTMSNEPYSKQTQSKPISNAQTPCPACRPRDCHVAALLAKTSLHKFPRSLLTLGLSIPPLGEAATQAMQRGSAFTFSKWYYSVLSCGGEGAAGSVADIFFSRVASRIPQVLVNCAGVALLAGCEEPFG